MENWCSGFLAIVKCFSTGHLLANKIIYVTLYMLYIYIYMVSLGVQRY